MTETKFINGGQSNQENISALNNGLQFGIVNVLKIYFQNLKKKEKRFFFLITVALNFLLLSYPNPSKFNNNILELKKQEAF